MLSSKKFTKKRELINLIDFILNLNEIEKKVLSKYRNFSSMDEIRNFYGQGYKFISYSSYYIMAVIFNLLLFDSNLCPLIFYAFHNRQWRMEVELSKIVELSLFYFYRLVEFNKKVIFHENIEFSMNGSTSYFFFKGKKIYKFPKNLAAKLYILPQEYEHAIYLREIGFKEFLADNYTLNKEKLLLGHRFEEGENGEYYLFNKKITSEQILSLETFYEKYINRENKEIVLDIHPGNFIWVNNKWILIDVGPIPDIGREYYEFASFKEYFYYVWLMRFDNMKKYPIRSVDLDINKNSF